MTRILAVLLAITTIVAASLSRERLKSLTKEWEIAFNQFENYDALKEKAGDARFESTLGGELTTGKFDDVFRGFRQIVRHADTVYTPLAFSGNTVILRASWHIAFKNGCTAMFEGIGIDEYDDSGKLIKAIGYGDDEHSSDFLACVSQNMNQEL